MRLSVQDDEELYWRRHLQQDHIHPIVALTQTWLRWFLYVPWSVGGVNHHWGRPQVLCICVKRVSIIHRMYKQPNTYFGHQFWMTQASLFRIVANVWAKPIDSSAKVVVWATDNLGGCHPRFEGLEHFRKGRMQELAPKLAEWRVILVSIIAYTYC